MPTTVVLDPVGMKPPTLISPLSRDAIFTLSWDFADLGQRQVLRQECLIRLSATHALAVEVGPALRKYSFHLSTGTNFDPAILSAHVRPICPRTPLTPMSWNIVWQLDTRPQSSPNGKP